MASRRASGSGCTEGSSKLNRLLGAAAVIGGAPVAIHEKLPQVLPPSPDRSRPQLWIVAFRSAWETAP